VARKHPASHSTAYVRRSPSDVRAAPEAEERLREAFPELWARYQWLLAARRRRERKPS
jgi:hypothetical protein